MTGVGTHLPRASLPAGASEPRQKRRRRRWLLLLLLLLAAIPSVVTTKISIDMYIEGAWLPNDAFATPAIDIVADPPVLIVAGGMVPGDYVSGSLEIRNGGGAPLRYAVTTATTDHDGKGLAALLLAEIRTGGSGCQDLDGELLYRGSLRDARIGNAETGTQSGDRQLAPGAVETLCIRVSMPRPGGDEYQAASTSAAFTVVAEEDQR